MRHLSALFPSISLCLLFSFQTSAQNSFQIIGVTGKTDRANRLIRTTNGDFVMAGKVDNNAALYRFDCSGRKNWTRCTGTWPPTPRSRSFLT